MARKRKTILAPVETPTLAPPPPVAVALATRAPREWARTWEVPADVYAGADAVHGWTLHEHHAAEPIQITEDAFLDAVAALETHPIIAAPDACSPHRGRRL